MKPYFLHQTLITQIISATVLLTLLLGVVHAADTNEIPPPSAILDQNLSTEEREDLLARLSDEQVRSIVWQLIRTEKGATNTHRLSGPGTDRHYKPVSCWLTERAKTNAKHRSHPLCHRHCHGAAGKG